MTDQQLTAVEALHAFARRHVDAEAAQALIDEATRELSGQAPTAASGTAPDSVVMHRVLEHALRKPVPCPKCQRTATCRCAGADRTEGRIEVVLGALAPWLNTGSETA